MFLGGVEPLFFCLQIDINVIVAFVARKRCCVVCFPRIRNGEISVSYTYTYKRFTTRLKFPPLYSQLGRTKVAIIFKLLIISNVQTPVPLSSDAQATAVNLIKCFEIVVVHCNRLEHLATLKLPKKPTVPLWNFSQTYSDKV
jgi:hypothetical protein